MAYLPDTLYQYGRSDSCPIHADDLYFRRAGLVFSYPSGTRLSRATLCTTTRGKPCQSHPAPCSRYQHNFGCIS